MSRRILLLIVPLLLAAAVSTHAQARADEFVWQDSSPGYLFDPPPHYVPNMQPSARFPLTVQLRTDAAGARYGNFVGHGIVHVFNPRGEDLSFHYRCGISFPAYQPTEFYARWVTPERKLEIVLLRPGTNHTRTCRMSTAPPTPNSSATTSPAP